MKVCLWGMGKMNKIILRYCLERGYKIVACFGNHNEGEDAGTWAGLDPIGVKITNPKDAPHVLKETKP